MAQWNTLDTVNTVLEQPKPMPPETIHGAFWRYAVYLGIFGGMGRMGEVIPDRVLSTLIASAGNITFFFFLAAMLYEVWHTERKWKLHEAMERAKLPKEKPLVTEIHNHFETGTSIQEKIQKYDNPPTEAFIRWLFGHSNGDGRIPGERAFLDSEEWKGTPWNEWLTILESEGILAKTGTHKNAMRKLEMTLQDALKHFGYSTTLPQVSK